MKSENCPYVKISEEQALIKQIYSPVSSSSDIYNTPSWKDFSLVPKANAQGVTSTFNSVSESLSDQLTVPFLILFLSFFLFIILMSVVYLYHWRRFSMNDPFIMNFAPIYFVGLVVLVIPLIFNIFF